MVAGKWVWSPPAAARPRRRGHRGRRPQSARQRAARHQALHVPASVSPLADFALGWPTWRFSVSQRPHAGAPRPGSGRPAVTLDGVVDSWVYTPPCSRSPPLNSSDCSAPTYRVPLPPRSPTTPRCLPGRRRPDPRTVARRSPTTARSSPGVRSSTCTQGSMNSASHGGKRTSLPPSNTATAKFLLPAYFVLKYWADIRTPQP